MIAFLAFPKNEWILQGIIKSVCISDARELFVSRLQQNVSACSRFTARYHGYYLVSDRRITLKLSLGMFSKAILNSRINVLFSLSTLCIFLRVSRLTP